MSEKSSMSDKNMAAKAKARRMAGVLFLVALSFYVAFIAMTALNK
jgi:uncharacterized membrane protein (DUF485 family)